MDNVFKDIDDFELKEIYKDYIGSKILGFSVVSFKPYAKQLKDKYFSTLDYSLNLCIDIVKGMYFEEVADRYFKKWVLK